MTIPVFKFSLLLIGMSGMIAQIVLLRELLISFLGNELTLGVILANWLILVAIGSTWSGKSAERLRNKREVFVILQMTLSVAFPLAILLCRVFKHILLTTPGEALCLALLLREELVSLKNILPWIQKWKDPITLHRLIQNHLKNSSKPFEKLNRV